MAAKKKAAKAGAGAVAAGKAARSNPYLTRLVEDEELRDNLRGAYDSARKAYRRMANGKGPASVLMDDKKARKELKEAAHSLRTAADTLRSAKRKRKSKLGRLLLLTIVGAGVALAASEGLRKKVLDALFGAEEEFEYTSTTTPDSSSSSAGSSGSSSSSSAGDSSPSAASSSSASGSSEGGSSSEDDSSSEGDSSSSEETVEKST